MINLRCEPVAQGGLYMPYTESTCIPYCEWSDTARWFYVLTLRAKTEIQPQTA